MRKINWAREARLQERHDLIAKLETILPTIIAHSPKCALPANACLPRVLALLRQLHAGKMNESIRVECRRLARMYKDRKPSLCLAAFDPDDLDIAPTPKKLGRPPLPPEERAPPDDPHAPKFKPRPQSTL
jgi:hypothetical protein